MILQETLLAGAFVIDPEPARDERGSFARTYCRETFARHGLDTEIAQCSVSRNPHAGTLRGLHYQAGVHAEAKLVTCVRGEVYDVAVDLREGSPTRRKWFACRLSESNALALYIPKGFAHGFITLTDDCVLYYQISTPYSAEAARGVRWNDPALAIEWPREPAIISARDAAFPLLPQ